MKHQKLSELAVQVQSEVNWLASVLRIVRYTN